MSSSSSSSSTTTEVVANVNNTSSKNNGIAGRTNYSEWDKKVTELDQVFDEEERLEKEVASKALGLQDGKYPVSKADAEERMKQENVKKMKKTFDLYKKRDDEIMQIITNVFDSENNDDDDDDSNIRRITRKDLNAGKRVLTIADTDGMITTTTTDKSEKNKTIVLTSDLSLLECLVPTNKATKGKSFPDDAENDVVVESNNNSTTHHYGLIKLFLSHLKNVTVRIKCKLLSATLEVSHCSNMKMILEKTAVVSTIQMDLCQNVQLEFHDAMSGGGNNSNNNKKILWGQDMNDRIFHAGCENVHIMVYYDEYLEAEMNVDYIKDVMMIGNKNKNSGKEKEVQFVVSMNQQKGELRNERVIRHGTDNTSNRAMTQRELDVEKKRRETTVKTMMESSSIKIVDKEGNEVVKKKMTTEGKNDDTVEEEVYTTMNKEEMDLILQECEKKKALGNEAFGAGEYAQAVLMYTLALDKADELPDHDDDCNDKKKKASLFPRHVVLSNRSAAFLKLGQHEKALEDAISAQKMDSTYIKSIFRHGLALHALGRYQDAVPILGRALSLEPKNKQIKSALQFAEVRATQQYRKRMEQQ